MLSSQSPASLKTPGGFAIDRGFSMRRIVYLVIALVALGINTTASARDTRHRLPIKAALAKGQSNDKVSKDIKLYFGNQKAPSGKDLGTYTSNKKTNAANKSDEDACDIAFLSAIIALQDRARKEGGNAVTNIHSVYKNENVVSTTEYLCGAGAIMAGVALRGTVVKTK
jgi:uncharacterized protein YbjQ (UPF0145 family)